VLSQLTILTLLDPESLATICQELSAYDFYELRPCEAKAELLDRLEQHQEQPDCLLLQDHRGLSQLAHQLSQRGILLPTVIVGGQPNTMPTYHTAEVPVPSTQIQHIGYYINQAIAQFLKLPPACLLPEQGTSVKPLPRKVMVVEQHRLSEKLRERLGYLGVYYKRDPNNFFRNLSPQNRQKFLQDIKASYRAILLHYFSQEDTNAKIDAFVNAAFFADLPVTQIVEIHMELIDDFAKQLKLEGRGEEVLLDYRLTLIDAIAHLCEMYRRSIPRES